MRRLHVQVGIRLAAVDVQRHAAEEDQLEETADWSETALGRRTTVSAAAELDQFGFTIEDSAAERPPPDARLREARELGDFMERMLLS